MITSCCTDSLYFLTYSWMPYLKSAAVKGSSRARLVAVRAAARQFAADAEAQIAALAHENSALRRSLEDAEASVCAANSHAAAPRQAPLMMRDAAVQATRPSFSGAQCSVGLEATSASACETGVSEMEMSGDESEGTAATSVGPRMQRQKSLAAAAIMVEAARGAEAAGVFMLDPFAYTDSANAAAEADSDGARAVMRRKKGTPGRQALGGCAGVKSLPKTPWQQRLLEAGELRALDEQLESAVRDLQVRHDQAAKSGLITSAHGKYGPLRLIF